MKISIIAAIGNNNELGKDNQLLWKLPNDLKRFKQLTSGHTVIMGRKTFESIGKPLPNRHNIVITRDKNYNAPGITLVHSLEEALRLASLEQGKEFEEVDDEIEVFILGGGQVYKEAMKYATHMYITHVDGEFEADTFFPVINPEWKIEKKEDFPADEANQYNYSFVNYKK